MTNGIGSSNCLERLMENEFCGLLNRFIKYVRKERDCSQAQLLDTLLSVCLRSGEKKKDAMFGSTHADGAPRPDPDVLDIFHRSPRIPHDAMNRKSGQAHGG